MKETLRKVKITAKWFAEKEGTEVGTEMEIVKETEKAYLIRYNCLCHQVWCPKSACELIDSTVEYTVGKVEKRDLSSWELEDMKCGR